MKFGNIAKNGWIVMKENDFKYDPTQLVCDLRRIVSLFGERTQHGFFAIGVFETDDCKIIDPYITEPEIYFQGDKIPLNTVAMQSAIAKFVLHTILKIEEQYDYKIFKLL